MLFIRATHSIGFSALGGLVTPSRSAICFTSCENIFSVCRSISGRKLFNLPFISRYSVLVGEYTDIERKIPRKTFTVLLGINLFGCTLAAPDK